MADERRQPISYAAIWNMVWPMVRPFRWVVVFLFLLSLIGTALTITEPYIYGSIIDSVTASVGRQANPSDGFTELMPLLTAWAIIVLLASFLVAVTAWTAWYLGNKFEQVLGERMFEKLLTLTVRRFQDERAGAMLNRFANGKEALWSLSHQLMSVVLPSVVAFLLIVVAGIFLQWQLTLVVLAFVPVDAAIGFHHLRVSMKRQEQMNDKWEETTGLVGDAFSNITTVQGEAGEQSVVARFAKVYRKALEEQLRINVQWAFVDAGTSAINICGRLVLFVVGVRLVFSGGATLGTLVMFLGFVGFLYASVQAIFNGLPEIVRSLNRVDRLARMWKEVPEVRNLPGAKPVGILRGDVEFDDVWFGYAQGDRPVLRGITLRIPAGTTVAMVGESGAGKSTLARLLIRFADPTRGVIRFDGTDIRQMTLATLRPNVGFVMQENLLFHDTVAYNIQFGKPNASREEMIQAAKRAQAHMFISKLKNGYDTVVGERGVKLSGGQKQRIALARVLLANPPILVLDEATSALDSKTEHDLQQALREVMKNRTTIVIAHRLSTVMDADTILVMDKGRIVDQGTHDDLICRENLYKKFWEIQAGGYV